MDTVTRIEDHAYRIAIDERIRELIAWRRWYRQHAEWGSFMVLAAEHRAELRALLKLARQARRTARPVVERMDPMTEAEARYAWGDR